MQDKSLKFLVGTKSEGVNLPAMAYFQKRLT